jgi:Flp pilus assembly protein TadD
MAKVERLPGSQVDGNAGRGAHRKRGRDCAVSSASGRVARIFAFVACGLFLPFVVFSQDNGTTEKEWFGNGVAISVTVHDDSGAPIPSPVTVKLLRGMVPAVQTETSGGKAVLIVNKLGEFTLVVDAPGFREAQKDISIGATGNAQADIYLRRVRDLENTAAAGARPVLAPKAKEALDKGLAALSAGKTGEAEKQIALAMKLAPGNPDVLYAQGALFIRGGKWMEAQSVLEKATQIDPTNARAFAALGMALCDQGKYEAAIGPLEKSLQLDGAESSSSAWEAQWALAKAHYEQREYPEAVKLSQAAFAGANGKEPKIALLVAQTLTAVGEYEEAARVLREFLRTNGDRKEAPTARRWLENLTKDGKIQTARN